MISYRSKNERKKKKEEEEEEKGAALLRGGTINTPDIIVDKKKSGFIRYLNSKISCDAIASV